MSEFAVQPFLEAVLERYGYDLRPFARSTMRRRMRVLVDRLGLGSTAALAERVLADSNTFLEFLDTVTIHASEMFRDPSFFAAFRDQVVPILRTHPLIRIWHAGCGSGEEVYSVAILLEEAGLYDRAQIYGTDLSPVAITRAKSAVFPLASVRVFSENYQQFGGTEPFSTYYRAAYDHIALKESLRRNVMFFQHDLISDHGFGEMQAIFCRNVLMYLDRQSCERIFGVFRTSLGPGGFLALGKSERLPATALGGFNEFAPERIFRRRQ